MTEFLALEEAILNTMPFSDELINWCKKNEDFKRGLKNIYASKFLSLGAIVVSYSPNYPKDQVIGVYTYAYKMKKPVFKQDFIVNLDGENKVFILYTRNSSQGSSKYVKDINEFYKKYSTGGYYKNSHHLRFEDLPDELKERAVSTIQLANKIKYYDLENISQKHINNVNSEILELRKGRCVIIKKLKNPQL